MNHAIVVIPAQMQRMLQPKSGRHFRVGVMRADGVKREEDQN